MKIKKATDETNDIDTDLITVNNFFANLIKEIIVATYRNNKQLIPTFSPFEIYRYFDSMFKYLPKKSLGKIKKTMLYSNKLVYYNWKTTEKRTFNSTMLADITGLNSEQRISDFWEMLKSEHVYRVPLCYFCVIGKINFPLKIDFKIKRHLKTDMKKLFKKKKKKTAIGAPDAKIIFTKATLFQ